MLVSQGELNEVKQQERLDQVVYLKISSMAWISHSCSRDYLL